MPHAMPSLAADLHPAASAGVADASLLRADPQPLYRQLAALLQRRIDRHELAPGDALASEPALMAQFGVSRITVRQAIALLQRQGKVVVQRGKGSFVAPRIVRHELDALQGFHDALLQQGIEPQTQLLEFSTDAEAVGRAAPAGLSLPVRLSRLYTVDGRPFALLVGHLPQGAAALGAAGAERLMIYQILEQFLGVRVARADVAIRCAVPPRPVAKALGRGAREAVMVMERRSYDAQGTACEFLLAYIVADRFEFRLKVAGALELARSSRTGTA